ncbi:type VI secretion system ATPase TssH [Aquisalimonas lutea]|uniref:type VI secretion system ATPase TssH n=1 Tax=Aquisalimonas lutea TaxID=1327750 RepID=UPI0025B52390|nr:type VI secretion system ATPase TssH [Aquisalimonas lutea]MDN3519574.1 type VI secretion system ATPase TssH [Aquisalimonas lutea]
MEFEQLMQRMSAPCRELFEQGVATASSRSHHALQVEHWLREAVQQQDPEIDAVLALFDLERARLLGDLEAAVEALETGHAGFPRISTEVARLLFEAWMIASSQFEQLAIRPIHLLLALTENDVLRPRVAGLSSELNRLSGTALREQCQGLLAGTAQPGSAAGNGATESRSQALDQFTVDLTAQAREGRIDRVLGRDGEIRQMVDILCRRRQNNPILTGEAGVGKTAVVEGLARRIADDDVPERLRGLSLRTLDLGLLQAGAGVKGEFENRLKNVIHEVQTATPPVILFVDEAHTLIGAGNQAGGGDAANLLKPALARGDLRTIAATTWAEYKKYFESDAALTRRFQVVHVDEPDEDNAIVMLRGTTEALETHHGVAVLEEAIDAAVRLSNRYITGRHLPDKCVSLLDTACARVALSQTTTPPALEATQQAHDNARAELERLTRESRLGHDHAAAVAALEARCENLQASAAQLQERWRAAHAEVAHAIELRRRIEATDNGDAAETGDTTALRDELAATRARRAELEDGGEALLHECVDADIVARVVADWTGIPVGRMHTDEIKSVLQLREQLERRVIGQPHALELIARHMRTARARLADPGRPLGVFMLVGPSGVGKTETALALAEQLYGSEQAMTTINMSEFKEEHKVSLLMGSPPGYVGYGEGGVLTEAVRRKPYSVVLLDEIEKAHPGVQDLFYQVFDKGVLRDGEGRDIDFRNTVILMTSNTAAPEIERLCADPDTLPTAEGLEGAIAPTLRETYKPAFLGRLQVIPYYPLDDTALAEVVRLQLETIRSRMQDYYQVPLDYGEALIQHITGACNASDTGARQISAIVNNELLPQVAERILESLARGEAITGIHVDRATQEARFDVRVTTGNNAPEPSSMSPAAAATDCQTDGRAIGS